MPVQGDCDCQAGPVVSRYSTGDFPVQRLKARVKLLGSEKPGR